MTRMKGMAICLLFVISLMTSCLSQSYFAIQTKMTQEAAADACVAQGGVIASFHNDAAFEAASDLCETTCSTLDGSNGDCGCWTGLKDDGTEGNWYNVDGSAKDYMLNSDGTAKTGVKPWWSGEPNNAGNEDCVHIWKPQSFYLNDIACTDLNYAICEDTSAKEYEFFAITSKMNQASASAECQAQGGTIVSFHSDDDYNTASALCQDTCETYDASNGACGCWTGLKDDVSENSWYNEDGSAKDYLMTSSGSPNTGVFPWHSGEPNNWGSGEDCVHIWKAQGYDLNDIACSNTGYFAICKKEATYSPVGFFTIASKVTQSAGADLCEAQGGVIASFHNDAEFVEASDLCEELCTSQDGSNGDCGCWTGLKDDGTENVWYNEDGTDPDYMLNSDGSPKTGQDPWWSGEPNNWGSGEDCVHIWRPQSYYLNDIACTDLNYVMCRVTEIPTYFALTTAMNQAEAEAQCAAEGGVIASFHNDAAFEAASALCESTCAEQDGSNSDCGCWTGLKDDNTEGNWYNADGSSKDYMINADGTAKTGIYPWWSGEPNNAGNEDCVHIWKPQSFWLNDIACTDLNFAICEEIEEEEETVYEFFALTSKMNQASASAECQAQGGELASFHSDEDYETASTLCESTCDELDASNSGCGCWTGLKDDITENSWYNMDGSAKDYLMSAAGAPYKGTYPWHSGEPNDANGEDCVHIWKPQGYDLNDISCASTAYYAICKKEETVDATFNGNCDNYGTLLRSDNNGRTWTTLVEESGWNSWQVTLSEALNDVSRKTKLRVVCRDVGVIGAFIGEVIVDGAVYYTAEDGLWKVVEGATEDELTYKANGDYPWTTYASTLDSQAEWIWNGATTYNSLTFEFGFDDVFNPKMDATFAGNCDNYGTLLRSDNGGKTFTTLVEESGWNSWPTTLNYALDDVSARTRVRVVCRDVGVIGAFIGQISVDGDDYYTEEDGPWEVVSDYDGSLTYKDNGVSPWGGAASSLNGDAKWIWNGAEVYNSLTFEFNFRKMMNNGKKKRGVTAQFSGNCDNYGSLLRSDDRGASFTEIVAESGWNSWPTTLYDTFESVTCKTVLQVKCRDVGGIGAFIGQVEVGGEIYYTSDKINAKGKNRDGNVWSVVEDYTGDLTFKPNGDSPWGAAASTLVDDAVWVWNGAATYNTLTFEFKFQRVFGTGGEGCDLSSAAHAVPAKPLISKPVSRPESPPQSQPKSQPESRPVPGHNVAPRKEPQPVESVPKRYTRPAPPVNPPQGPAISLPVDTVEPGVFAGMATSTLIKYLVVVLCVLLVGNLVLMTYRNCCASTKTVRYAKVAMADVDVDSEANLI